MKFFAVAGNDKIHNEIAFQWSPVLTLETKQKIKEIFMSAWLGQHKFNQDEKTFYAGPYSYLSEEDLHLAKSLTKQKFLENVIDEEIAAWEKGKVTYVGVYLHEQLIGFASFESPIIKNAKDSVGRQEVYLRQGVIAAPYQHLNIGKLLANTISKTLPPNSYAVLLTRKVNGSALAFYQSVGAKLNDEFAHEGYSKDAYIGNERRVMPHIRSFSIQ